MPVEHTTRAQWAALMKLREKADLYVIPPSEPGAPLTAGAAAARDAAMACVRVTVDKDGHGTVDHLDVKAWEEN